MYEKSRKKAAAKKLRLGPRLLKEFEQELARLKEFQPTDDKQLGAAAVVLYLAMPEPIRVAAFQAASTYERSPGRSLRLVAEEVWRFAAEHDLADELGRIAQQEEQSARGHGKKGTGGST